jgi:tRNA A-37 threonylcarbamoyl transferase component Bud32/tetratricopeptide (TPR) repeat protein
MLGDIVAKRFELRALVGRGGFGEVYRAFDHETQELVAVKLLRDDLLDDEVHRRFDREARLLARTQSPNVVRYLAHGRDERNRNFIVTEWIEGEPLARLLPRGPMPLDQALRVLAQCARGLSALHELGILHRDVKPGNVMVRETDDGLEATLIDLGIAIAADVSAVTADGIVLGSPVYISPEQARGEPLTPASDVYSLGVLFFEMITGKRPFGGIDPLAIMGRVLLEEPARLRALRPDVPEGVEDAVQRAMQKDPAARFSSVRLFADAVIDAARAALEPTEESSHTHEAPGTIEYRVVAVVFAAVENPMQASAAASAVVGHGGDAHPIAGGRIVGTFGLARSTGDELERAARAALAMRELVPRVRVGVASGHAHPQGNRLAGDALDRAVEAFMLADAGQVRLDRGVAEHVEHDFSVHHDGRGPQLISAHAGGTTRGRVLMGRPLPMVGREREIALLQGTLLDAADQRAPRAALVFGAAGMGKSRLRAELVSRVTDGAVYLQPLDARGDPLERAMPYASIAGALRERARIQDGEAREAQRRKLRSIIPATAQHTFVVLSELAGVPLAEPFPPAVRAARTDPGLMAAQLRAAFLDWMRAVAQRTAQLVVIEDLHSADVESLDLFATALATLTDQPIALLGLARDDSIERISPRFPGALELRLAPLGQRACEQLVDAVLGRDVSPAVRRTLVTRAAGNPLFLEELVRATAAGRGDELPLAVQAAVQARLDKLDLAERRVARAASVFGQTFWVEGVSYVVGHGDIETAIDALVAHEIVAPRASSRIVASREYTFRHQLVRDAVYAMIVPEDRALLHRAAAEWLSPLEDREPAMVAHHAELADENEHAARLYAVAAQVSAAEHAYETAHRQLDRALTLETRDDARFDLHLARADALLAMARAEESMRDIEAAEHLAKGRVDRVLQVALRFAHARQLAGDPLDGANALASALAAPDASRVELKVRLEAILRRAHLLALRGQAADALRLAREVLDDPSVPDDTLVAVQPLADQVVGLTTLALGDLDDALGTYRSALRRARATGDAVRALDAGTYLGFVCIQVGLYDEAARQLGEMREEARRLGLPRHEGYALQHLGIALARAGDEPAGIEAERDARAIGDRLGLQHLACGARMYMARLLTERGIEEDLHDALAQLREAALLAPSEDAWRAFGCAARSRALLALQRVDDGVRAARDGYMLLEESGAVDPWDGWIRLTYIEALIDAGRGRDAEAVLAVACEKLRAKADRIGDENVRRRFLRDVPEHARLVHLAGG